MQVALALHPSEHACAEAVLPKYRKAAVVVLNDAPFTTFVSGNSLQVKKKKKRRISVVPHSIDRHEIARC